VVVGAVQQPMRWGGALAAALVAGRSGCLFVTHSPQVAALGAHTGDVSKAAPHVQGDDFVDGHAAVGPERVGRGRRMLAEDTLTDRQPAAAARGAFWTKNSAS